MTKIQKSTLLSNRNAFNSSLLIKSLGTVSTDSLKLRIPTRLIINFDISRLQQTIVTLNSDYVLVKQYNKFTLDDKNKKLVIGLRAAKGGKNYNEQELIFMFSSKILGGAKYYQGITKNNINTAYNNIKESLIKNGIGYLEYNTFMNGIITDIDIKKDCIDKQGLSLSKVANHIIDSNGAKRTVSQFSQKGRASFKTGLQLNTRQTGSVGNPFIKVYNKGIEMKYSMEVDNDSFFNTIPSIEVDSKITNVWRTELTIKDSTMLKANNLPNRLGAFLEVSEKKYNEVLEDNFMKWAKKEIRPLEQRVLKLGFNSEELLLMMNIKNNYITFDSYIDMLIFGGVPKRTIERKKKRFIELYKVVEQDMPKIQKTSLDSSKRDINIEGQSSSDLSSFCGGIMYCLNA